MLRTLRSEQGGFLIFNSTFEGLPEPVLHAYSCGDFLAAWNWEEYSGWVAKSVARQLATAVLWVRIQISLKNHKWAT